MEDLEISLQVELEYIGTAVVKDTLAWTVASDDQKLSVCYTSIDLFTVEYDKYNPIIDITQSGLWLDVYRYDDAESYIINFVKVTVTMTTA